MPIYHHQIIISKPIDEVFAAVANVTSHPQWQQGLLRVETLDQNQARIGAKGFDVRGLMGREVRFPYEITVYKPPSAWGFEAASGPVHLGATLTFSSDNAGTLVKSELRVYGLPGMVMGPMLLAQQKQNYIHLKELLEAGKL